MMICIPIDEDQGLESPVSAHFGSAVRFMFVDTDTGACRSVANQHAHQGHGQCQPLSAVRREPVEGIVVGGIGRRALDRLVADGIGVFRSGPATVKDTVTALKAGTLARVTPADACAGHGHQHGHHRGHHGEGRGAGRCGH